jgi:hypothetical protein
MKRGSGYCRWLRGLVLLVLFAAPPVFGQETGAEEPELLTDRPDFTETSFAVPAGSLQFESGFTYTNGADGERGFNAPEILLRYGIRPRTELRLGFPDYVTVRGGGQRVGQWGDTYLGFKQELGKRGGTYAFSMIPAVTLPTGGSDVSSDRVDPEFVLTWSRELGPQWSVGGIVGYAWATEEDERNGILFPTLSFARSLSDRVGTFFEYAAEFPERGGDAHLFHHGYTYALSPVRQLDFHVGVGLSAAAPDFFIAAGYSFRR